MAKTRTPQRTRCDWGAAKARYVELGPDERSFARIAREYRVTSLTVRKHAHRDGWLAAADEADTAAADAALAGAIKTRAQRVQDILKITDGLVDHFIDAAASKAADASYLDLERMMKLAELVEGEATDRISVAEVQSALVVVMVAGPELLAELTSAGLKGPALLRAFKERFPQLVRERVALNSGGSR